MMSSMRRALRRRVGRVGGFSELSEAQRELVRLVRRRPRIRVGEAAVELGLAPNTVSTLVTALYASGWLRRETDPADGRSALLYLAPEAETRVEEWRDRRLTALNAALATISEDERQRLDRAVPVLRQIVQSLEESA